MQTHPRLLLHSAATVILVFLFFSACGGSGAPAAPTPTAQSITITSSSDLLVIGASEVFSATASMSGGGTQP